MKRPRLPMDGSCRCGQTRIRITADPIMTAACHCGGCQRMAASAFSLTAMIPAAAFHVVQGSPLVGGLHGAAQDHMFCPHCLTWMFTRIAGISDFVNLRPTMLDDASWFVPFIETCTAEKLPWATTPAEHCFTAFPPPESHAVLMQQFAAQLHD